MLDADTSSYVIKGTKPFVDRRLADTAPGAICISSVTRAELLYGVRRRPGAHRLARLVEEFLSRVPSLPWDNPAADRFATIAAELERAGRHIGTFDAMIAAHALAADAVIVTNNVEHFSRVSGLTLQNWAADP
jgi:tRNA(fMet)-specific endonuclease VapC